MSKTNDRQDTITIAMTIERVEEMRSLIVIIRDLANIGLKRPKVAWGSYLKAIKELAENEISKR